MFMNRDLSVTMFANGWTCWHYKTKDLLETVSKDGYFDKVKSIMNTGDVIYLTDGNWEAAIRVIKIDNGVVKLKPLS